MLPNALRPSATDHVPVLADEVRRLLDVQPGADRRRCDVRRGWPCRAAGPRSSRQGALHCHRPRSVGTCVLRALPQAGRRPGAVPARRVRDRPRAAGDERRSGGRDPARPRSLEHAARPARARILLRGRCPARHADGSVRGRDRSRHRQRRTGARAPGDLPPLRRGALCAADRTRDRAPPPPRAVPPDGRARRHDQERPFRRPRASARGIRPSASSRLCGLRSTTSSGSSRRRFPPPSSCCDRAGGSP